MSKAQGIAQSANQSQFKNRIINGNMAIDQRNAGASVTPTANPTYTLDRWLYALQQASKMSIQQSTTAPTGFVNSLLATSLSAYSPLSSDYHAISQRIEGLNMSDFAWGTASAVTVTLSFWVRSSLTGTFSGSIVNSAADRSYPFSYTINAANTWEQKSVTIAGDTSGTWLTTNGIGARLFFSLGTGSTYLGTSGSWASSFYVGSTGSVQPTATNGATFYITGVQLEKGTVATSFDYRPYGTELALCQRYYEKISNTGNNAFCSGMATQSTVFRAFLGFQVEKRTAPSVSYSSTSTFLLQGNNTNYAVTATGTVAFGTKGVYTQFGATGMTQGYAYTLIDGSGSYADFSAEL